MLYRRWPDWNILCFNYHSNTTHNKNIQHNNSSNYSNCSSVPCKHWRYSRTKFYYRRLLWEYMWDTTLIIDTHHTDQPLKVWFSYSGDIETCQSIKISISEIWPKKQYLFYYTFVRESNSTEKHYKLVFWSRTNDHYLK